MSDSRSDRGGKISGGGTQDSAICQAYGSHALMSAPGQKQPFQGVRRMPAPPPRATELAALRQATLRDHGIVVAQQ